MVDANSIEPIDVTDDPEIPDKHSRKFIVYDKSLCQDNKPFTEFINKCLVLDPTVEMERIINGVLLPSYCKADTEYKKSDKFIKILKNTFQRLVNDPKRKYSYITGVYETLKVHKSTTQKRRVELITLSTTVSGKTHDNYRKRVVKNNNNIKLSPKKPKLDVIELDCDEEDQSDDSDVVVVDKPNSPGDDRNDEIFDNQSISQVSLKGNKVTDKECINYKENNVCLVDSQGLETEIMDQINDDPIEIVDSQEIKIIEEIKSSNVINRHNVSNEDKENFDERDNSIDSGNKLLVPQMEILQLEKKETELRQPEDKRKELSEAEKAERVKEIESRIAMIHKKIAHLELAEVTDDTEVSPYVQCHRLEAQVVILYKELCDLVNVEPVKGRQVRLKVSEGRPEGPVRRLEEFLNMSVDEEGVARFPEYMDVVKCVRRANREDGLGWSEAKIRKEAEEIFTYCGRALQKRRQHREYKHLRARVPRAAFDDDPALGDAELAAKLARNREVALTREKEIMERHRQAAKESTSMNVQSTVDKTQDSSGDSDSEAFPGDEEIPIEPTNLKENCQPENTLKLIESYDETQSAPITIKQEPVEVPAQYKGDISLVIEISDSDSSDDEACLVQDL